MKYSNSTFNLLSVVLLLIACSGFRLEAQMTIGHGATPAKAALLQLKDKEPAPGTEGATAETGGLLLPRVELNSLTDFSLPISLTGEQKEDHTGLLVYNVETSGGLAKGVYQWCGTEWKMLKKISKTEGASVKKEIYQGTAADATRVISLGKFEFRMTGSGLNPTPQFRLTGATATIHWQVNEYLYHVDYPKPLFYLMEKTMTPNTWYNCLDALMNIERDEVWIADLDDDGSMYRVQFMVLGYTNFTYVIVAQKY
ncbi:MAG: hypothetical protein LBS04_04980 [Tannerellaceae bacterium]|jgi:hypothetical protein|nr:hypothetical protein [Tannerellaceae bacterium]